MFVYEQMIFRSSNKNNEICDKSFVSLFEDTLGTSAGAQNGT